MTDPRRPSASAANDNGSEPAFTLTRSQLEGLISAAVRQALDTGSGAPFLVDKQAMAQRLGCSASQVDHLRKQGLPVVKVGMMVRFEPTRVLEWLRSHEGTG